MTEVSTLDILRIIAAGLVLILGIIWVIVTVRRLKIRWSGNAGIGLGVTLIIYAIPLGWLCARTDPAPTLVFLALGFWALYRGIRRKRREVVAATRRRTGHCVNCGYDLTGNVTGTCPECGRPLQRVTA